MALLNIGGVDMPAPTTYKATFSDLDSSDSGRSETGVMVRNRVRQGVAKIEYSAQNISTADVTTILDAVQPEKLAVTYFFGGSKTAEMYVSDRQCELRAMQPNGVAVWNVSLSLVEF